MKKRAPHLLIGAAIGAAVVLFIAATVPFVIWQLVAADQRPNAYYVVPFSADVQGLTIDSPVYYRGMRVGRVADISLISQVDTQRSTGRERLTEKIRVTVTVDSRIDIRERSYAMLERTLNGDAFVQIVGRLEVDQVKPKKTLYDKPYPEIREGASNQQATSTGLMELVTKVGVTVDRLNELLSPDNIQTVSAVLAKLDKLTDTLNLVAMEIGPQDAQTKGALTGKEPGELRKTLVEARAALGSIDGAAGLLSKQIGDSKAR